MKTYSYKDAPLAVFGVPFFHKNLNFQRVPPALRETLGGDMERLGSRCPGARIGFRTNASEFSVKLTFKKLTLDIGMSLFAGQSIQVMVGERKTSRLIGLVDPPNYETTTIEKTFKKSGEMEEVTLWLPRNDEVIDVTVTMADDALIEPPTPYACGKTLFYGSSITEGGCCCNVTNNYVALLSRWLDMDFYNFGFSGNARGQLEMADYINSLTDVNMIVMDYDHNAPNAEHLQNTHELFFKRLREKHPTMPILMLSRPDFERDSDGVARRAVIEQTYQNAIAAGDKNVYYIDGETFFGKTDRGICTIDTVHPNYIGFYRMAETILPTMQTMLDSIS